VVPDSPPALAPNSIPVSSRGEHVRLEGADMPSEERGDLFDDDPLVLCQLNPTVVSMMVSTTKPTIWLGWRMAMMTGTRADEVERLTSLQSLP
jgi:hypothetical protein